MPLGKDKDAFKNADYLDHWAVRALMAKVYPDTAHRDKVPAVKIAAGDYHSLRAKLHQTRLTEEKVLDMKAQLKDVPEELLISGRQFKYICPVKVKELYEARKA